MNNSTTKTSSPVLLMVMVVVLGLLALTSETASTEGTRQPAQLEVQVEETPSLNSAQDAARPLSPSIHNCYREWRPNEQTFVNICIFD